MMHWRSVVRVSLAAAILSLFGSRLGYAEEGYITDSFEVTLRTGPSNENKIIAMPLSGQRLEILETQGDWTRVQMIRGGGQPIEGWLLNRYVIKRVPWEIQAKALTEENHSLKEKLSRVKDERKTIAQSEEELGKALKGRDQTIAKLTADYEALKRDSAEFLKVKSLYQSAQTRMETAEATVKTLSAELEALRASQRNRWFALGALVLLCGLMIGVVMGRREKKRRTYL